MPIYEVEPTTNGQTTQVDIIARELKRGSTKFRVLRVTPNSSHWQNGLVQTISFCFQFDEIQIGIRKVVAKPNFGGCWSRGLLTTLFCICVTSEVLLNLGFVFLTQKLGQIGALKTHIRLPFRGVGHLELSSLFLELSGLRKKPQLQNKISTLHSFERFYQVLWSALSRERENTSTNTSRRSPRST